MIETIHAGAVALGEWGVLIRGAPGSGKSALGRAVVEGCAAEGRFGRLVADDRTALEVAGGRLIARPAPSLAGLQEVRGIGILVAPMLPAVRINLVVDLEDPPERLPEPADRRTVVAGIDLPRLALPVRCAEHSAALLRSVLNSNALTAPDRAAQRVFEVPPSL